MNLDFYYGFNSKESKSTLVYSHSKLIRKQDIEKKKKRNKIEWMKKMYKNGMLKPKPNDQETAMMINESAENIINAYENNKIDQIDDWEVDQLLDWTNGLSYNDYVQSWKTIGTTAKSDKLVNERFKLNKNIQIVREDTFDTLPESFQEFTPSKQPIFGSSTPLH